ncbi:ATP-binding protein [Empedobacter sp. UBA7620]|uniref:ATP-binding protein n=1 Tax=Empedobacter sp. UBA7620 TaxID=1946452 RepID=UPI0025C563EC|nr:ATP-binding protein [Empedobacter sp. UBA7620]
MNNYFDATPNPEFLIKSIAEQGYSFETAIADLIDNSISAKAKRIEILSDYQSNQFTLFIADNGCGMTADILYKSMLFPSTSPEEIREKKDLGRFGLGLKTASFSQTRNFTVISKSINDNNFTGYTWDVNHLKRTGKWEIIKNSEEEIESILNSYYTLSKNEIASDPNFEVQTLIVWNNLYKYDDFLENKNKIEAFKTDITFDTSDYLSIVFHRFLDGDQVPKLTIRINNTILESFNPFPDPTKYNVRALQPSNLEYNSDFVEIQGYVLPSNSIGESKESENIWTPRNKSLSDMEGIYVYRENRLILFGGWQQIIKKQDRFKLARLKVEIGNSADHIFHLNVSKSQIKIPFELKVAFKNAIEQLVYQAEKEFYNRNNKSRVISDNKKSASLFVKEFTNKGTLLIFNDEFPILKEFKSSLSKHQLSQLNVLLKLTSNTLNSIRKEDDISFYNDQEKDGYSTKDLEVIVSNLFAQGFEKEFIKNVVLSNLGINSENIPEPIKELMKN